jgi:hypothetical protein
MGDANMENSISESDFVIIDLPVRLSTPELMRLNLAVAKAIRRETLNRPGIAGGHLV